MLKTKHILSGILLLLSGSLVNLQAQVITPGSEQFDYFKILQIRQDSVDLYHNYLDMIRSYAPEGIVNDRWGLYDGRLQGDGWKLLPVRTRTTYNSDFPRSRNNGPLWYGRGLTQELHGGVQARYGMLEVTLYPVLYYSQNRDFELGENPLFPLSPSKSPYSYPHQRNIDYVQRFGDQPYYYLHPGQSDISLLIQNARIGVTTQNTIIGPAWYNPITMSANAPGIPQFYIQNPRPIFLWIGEGEFRFTWGATRESQFFDFNPDNNWNYFTSFSGGWVVHFLPGLNIGFNRVFLKRGDEFDFALRDIFASFHNFNSPVNEEDGFQFNDDLMQMTSITARYTARQSGLEVYFEYVRNDFGGGPFGPNPEHSRAYTLGFTQVYDLPDRSWLALTGEVSTNAATRTATVRQPASYYVHSIVEQGYTHQGQLLGSYTGPGGIAYNVFLRRYTDRGMHGFTVDYLRTDDDFYFLHFDDFNRHDYQFSLGYRGVYRTAHRVDFGIESMFTWRRNMHMQEGNNKRQFTLGLSATYRF